jgi:diguanylate cyclase (GGDEF)-like protein
MISLKRYLDSNSDAALREVLAAVIAAYQSALNVTGASATKACPSVAPELRRKLTGFGLQLTNVDDAAVVTGTEALVTQELQQWGEAAASDLQQKTKDVKELLVVLAEAAATIAASDETHAGRFQAFTSRLERIADLDDIRTLRSSLMRSAAELRTCVQQMSANSRASVSKLQAEVTTYRTRLEAAEQTAARDTLTNLFNRGRVESHIDTRIAMGRPFSLALIDLDGFKEVNDRLGHAAGDELLKQFSTDLLANARPTDLVGRWGGDEFIIILDCGRKDAQAHIERIEKWVIGDYTIETADTVQKVRLDASIGVTEWRPGVTRRDLLEQADMAMYSQKRGRR